MHSTMHLPTVPYTAIDHANRRAAATGSVRYAQMTAGANYNGHSLSVHFNHYRGYWIVEHFWGERVVWARGELRHCLEVAREYYARGDKGANVRVSYNLRWPGSTFDHNPPESVAQFVAICRALGYYDASEKGLAFWTPKHDAVSEAMGAMSQMFPGLVGIACNLPDDATADDWKRASDAHMAGARPRRSA